MVERFQVYVAIYLKAFEQLSTEFCVKLCVELLCGITAYRTSVTSFPHKYITVVTCV
jgi:hypothetical protein